MTHGDSEERGCRRGAGGTYPAGLLTSVQRDHRPVVTGVLPWYPLSSSARLAALAVEAATTAASDAATSAFLRIDICKSPS
jgi:hypothetical protein